MCFLQCAEVLTGTRGTYFPPTLVPDLFTSSYRNKVCKNRALECFSNGNVWEVSVCLNLSFFLSSQKKKIHGDKTTSNEHFFSTGPCLLKVEQGGRKVNKCDE
jgi:hypothetical protein